MIMDFNISMKRSQNRKIKKDTQYKLYLQNSYQFKNPEKQILKAYLESHKSQIEVAKEFNISRTKIFRLLRRLKTIH